MSFGNMIGKLLQQGMASQSRSRLERVVQRHEHLAEGVMAGQVRQDGPISKAMCGVAPVW